MTRFADPYKKCLCCGRWIDGAQPGPGKLTLIPCGCRAGFEDVCPSWGPVDGCRCAAFNHAHPDTPIFHESREPDPGDSRVYGGPVPVVT